MVTSLPLRTTAALPSGTGLPPSVGSLLLEQQRMIDPECRPLAVLGGRQQCLHVGSARRRDHLQPGRLHQHGLRTRGMLRGAGDADADQRMEHDRHLDLAAAHVGDVGRLVDDLRPGFEGEAAGADGDDRVETRHRGADAHSAKAELGDRRTQDARPELVVQRLDVLGVEQAAEARAADDDDALVFAHQVADRLDLRFAERDFGHDRARSDRIEGSTAARRGSAPLTSRGRGSRWRT